MHIRIATKDDSPALAEIYAPIVERTHISFELEPPGPDEMGQRMAKALDRHAGLVAEDAGRVIGYAYASNYREKPAYRWSTETTIYVRDGIRGRGVGRSLYAALLRILSAQGYRRAFAGIALPNTGSVALHEALGFRHIGTNPEAGFKFGRWHDLGWWSFQLNTGDGEPQPPIPLGLLESLDTYLK
jgi:L-amino acid N-acyltransferase YncA